MDDLTDELFEATYVKEDSAAATNFQCQGKASDLDCSFYVRSQRVLFPNGMSVQRNYREEIPSDLPVPPECRGVLKLVQTNDWGPQVVLTSPRGGNEDADSAVSPHALRVRATDEDLDKITEEVRLLWDSPQRQDSIYYDSCEESMEISPERPATPGSINTESYFGDVDDRCSTKSWFSEGSSPFSWGGGEDSDGYQDITIGGYCTTSYPYLIHALLLDPCSAKRFPVFIPYGANEDGEDAMGYRPIRICFIGDSPRESKIIEARPARWDCIRRHVVSGTATAGWYPSRGLGYAQDVQREAWECDHTGSYPEDLYFERASGVYNAAMQCGGYGRYQRTYDHYSGDYPTVRPDQDTGTP